MQTGDMATRRHGGMATRRHGDPLHSRHIGCAGAGVGGTLPHRNQQVRSVFFDVEGGVLNYLIAGLARGHAVERSKGATIG